MRRRNKLRSVAKWVGIIGCMLVGISALIQTRWIMRCGFGPRVAVVLAGGSTMLSVNPNWPRSGFTVRPYKTWAETGAAWRHLGLYPDWDDVGGDHTISVPLWLWMIMFATIVVLCRNRRPKPGHCPCGYDLTGNESGTCPECGKEATNAEP